MRYLLDTHAYLWAVDESPRLSQSVLDAIENTSDELLPSIVSLWEIAIKLNIGRLQLNATFSELAIEQPAMHDVAVLAITLQHLELISRLPLHHRDPFDRLMVVQCLAEEMVIVNNDTVLDPTGSNGCGDNQPDAASPSGMLIACYEGPRIPDSPVDAPNAAGMISRPTQTVGAMAPASARMPRISARIRVERPEPRHATGQTRQ